MHDPGVPLSLDPHLRATLLVMTSSLSACFVGPDDIAARKRMLDAQTGSEGPTEGPPTDDTEPDSGGAGHPDDTSVDSDTATTEDTASGDSGDVVVAFPDTIAVPAGTFQMGSPIDEIGRDGDETRHTVSISHDLEVAVTEVTVGSFAAWMERPESDPGCPDCPQTEVTWHEAAAYTVALSDADGLAPCYACTSGDAPVCTAVGDLDRCTGWRLPTEAEWEYLARAGSTGAYPSGASLARVPDYYNCEAATLDDGGRLSDTTWYCASSGGAAQPVGDLQPNAFGLYDVTGNVWEWCHDGPRAYPSSGAVTDPIGPMGTTERVLRGGSHTAYAGFVRLATRKTADATEALPTRGFRFVRTLR